MAKTKKRNQKTGPNKRIKSENRPKHRQGIRKQKSERKTKKTGPTKTLNKETVPHLGRES